MSAKHTPGPWRLDDPIHCGILADDYHAIDAGPGFHSGSEPGFNLTGFMSLADARLISAAPDYRAATEAVLTEVRLLGPTSQAHVGGLLRAIKALRAAHAKATGSK